METKRFGTTHPVSCRCLGASWRRAGSPCCCPHWGWDTPCCPRGRAAWRVGRGSAGCWGRAGSRRYLRNPGSGTDPDSAPEMEIYCSKETQAKELIEITCVGHSTSFHFCFEWKNISSDYFFPHSLFISLIISLISIPLICCANSIRAEILTHCCASPHNTKQWKHTNCSSVPVAQVGSFLIPTTRQTNTSFCVWINILIKSDLCSNTIQESCCCKATETSAGVCIMTWRSRRFAGEDKDLTVVKQCRWNVIVKTTCSSHFTRVRGAKRNTDILLDNVEMCSIPAFPMSSCSSSSLSLLQYNLLCSAHTYLIPGTSRESALDDRDWTWNHKNNRLTHISNSPSRDRCVHMQQVCSFYSYASSSSCVCTAQEPT